MPDKFFDAVAAKSEKLQNRLARESYRYLKTLEKQEGKMKRILEKKDSTSASQVFGDVHKRYAELKNSLTNAENKFQKLYSSRLDSMTTALSFMNENRFFALSKDVQQHFRDAVKNYSIVQDKLNQTEYIKQQIEQRRAFLKGKIQGLGLSKEFRKYQTRVYYYREQIDNYKKVWENPHKLEAALLKVVVNVPSFKAFFSKHSELSNLFQLPGNDEVSAVAINGMQTRSMIMQQLGQQFGNANNATQAVNLNINDAGASLQPLKNKLQSISENGGDLDMPDFKPNQEKTKSFLQRIDLGINIQSTKSSYFFPSTTDFGLSVGYKFTSKIIAGWGTSYKMGWGADYRHIAISHQGVGLRSFGEMKLKGNFWFTIGGEVNYRSRFYDLGVFNNLNKWQQSALAGFSKKYTVSKVKGSMAILYDFLARKQRPTAQAVVFRLGYSLKK